MTQCTSCGQENRINMIYCVFCGQELDPSAEPDQTLPVNPLHRQVERPTSSQGSAEPGLTLRIVTDNGLKAISLPSGRQFVIGRADPDTSEPPDLDLSAYGALESGVSRRHAQIDFADGAARLTDLGSRNGTYINGKKLPPHQARILSSGDEIRLGRLVLYIYV